MKSAEVSAIVSICMGTQDFIRNLLDISDNQITGYCLSMLLEGFETSSGLMSYTLFELASHPDVQRQVQEEVDRVLLKSNGRFTDDAVQDMQFLESICYGTRVKYTYIRIFLILIKNGFQRSVDCTLQCWC